MSYIEPSIVYYQINISQDEMQRLLEEKDKVYAAGFLLGRAVMKRTGKEQNDKEKTDSKV